MDYTIIKKMIEDKVPDIKPFTYDYTLSPGVVFVPPQQIDDWKSSYLVLGEKDGFCTCIRTSFHDEKFTGPYDLIDNNIIFETWNAIQIPLTNDIKGYKKIEDDVLNLIIRVRDAWLSDDLPEESAHTGKPIDSDPDRRLFHEAELQANESLQNALLNEEALFSCVKLWEKTGSSINITPHFESLDSEGQLSALLGNLSLSFIWESTSDSLPPVATIREIASNTFSIVKWEPLENNKSFQFLSHVPESVNSMILNVEGKELKLEVLPSVDKNIVCEHSPLSLILFYIFNEIQRDPDCMIPDDLLDFGFGSLEQKAIQSHMNLKLISDKIGFLLLVGLFCEGISEIIKLGVFKWIETKMKNINAFEPENNFQQLTLRLHNWQKQGYRESIQWFYKNNYDVWSDVLRQYKNQVDPSVVLTEDDVEFQVVEMINKWDSILDIIYSTVSECGLSIFKSINDIFSNQKYPKETFVPVVRMLSENTQSNIPAILRVDITNSDDWYGLFDPPDDNVFNYLDNLFEEAKGLKYGGLLIYKDWTTRCIHVQDIPDDAFDAKIEFPLDSNCLFIIAGVVKSDDADYLTDIISEIKTVVDQNKKPDFDSIQHPTQKPVIWLQYSFTFNQGDE